MRFLIYPLLGLATLYTAHFAADLLIPLETTDADIEQAHAYLVTYNLPTPDYAFSRDGCTLWPDQLPKHDFSEACLTHDIAYWAGGDNERKTAANLQFKEDVEKSGPAGFVLAPIMYYGVTLLGDNGVSRVIRSHWGFGWK